MSNKIYTQVPVPKFPHNTFSLSRPVAGTMTMHMLYPSNAHVVVPGDGFIEGSEILAKLEPMIAPTMCKIDIDQHGFFVPYWQLNQHFDDFITGGEDGQYTDHLPFVTVDWLYDLVHSLLMGADASYWPQGIVAEGEFVDVVPVYDEFKYRLKLASHIIDMCDWFRAVPFNKPIWIEEPSDPSTEASLSSWIAANRKAFEDLNKDLQYSENIVNLLPFFAYVKIYSEYFRDENLSEDLWKWARSKRFDELHDNATTAISPDLYDLTDGFLGPIREEWASSYTRSEEVWKFFQLFAIQPRAWSKDRFTSGLPFAQKGDDVLIPIHGVADVSNTTEYSGTGRAVMISGDDHLLSVQSSGESIKQSVDLSSANMSTIRELREAFAAESYAEANGRFGNRYPEWTLGQFGVYTPDARLPRAIYLGSRTQPVVISDVTQTSESNETPQGNLAGKGASYSGGRIFKFRFTLHGLVLILTSIRVNALYQTGIAPMFGYYDRTDYSTPRFARLGEEPIKLRELYVGKTDDDGGRVDDQAVFAYGPRYSSFKSDVGSIHGYLKTSRSFWTMARRWNYAPKLNEEFIYASPRTDSFAMTGELLDQFNIQISFKCRAQRILPFWGTPSI